MNQKPIQSIMGLGLILFPTFILAHYITGAMGNGQLSSWLALLASSVMSIFALAIGSRLFRHSPGLTTLAVTVVLISTVLGSAGWDYIGLVEAVAGTQAAEALTASGFFMPVISILGLANVFSLIALSAGLLRNGLQTVWVSATQIVGLVLFIVSWFATPIVGIAAGLFMLIGFGYLSGEFFGQAQNETLATA